MTAFFITATGTDIGKTFVATGLIRHMHAAGRPVAAIKPVVSGLDPGTWHGSDPAALLVALGARPNWRRSSISRHGGSRRRFPRTWRPDTRDAQSHSRRWSNFAVVQ